jgi:hypothetical protein
MWHCSVLVMISPFTELLSKSLPTQIYFRNLLDSMHHLHLVPHNNSECVNKCSHLQLSKTRPVAHMLRDVTNRRIRFEGARAFATLRECYINIPSDDVLGFLFEQPINVPTGDENDKD